jgi:catechol 2,3-dioxygenase-like lactoylglutathione lyase family enzyme
VSRFHISALDHVAIGVADVESSCAFYARVLGFERLFPEWDVPIFMGTDGIGLAIFDEKLHPSSVPDDAEPPAVRILHIAFRVDREGFATARRELPGEGVKVTFSDHGISHSLYFRDPDGHLIELTTYELEAEDSPRSSISRSAVSDLPSSSMPSLRLTPALRSNCTAS